MVEKMKFIASKIKWDENALAIIINGKWIGLFFIMMQKVWMFIPGRKRIIQCIFLTMLKEANNVDGFKIYIYF